MEPRHERPHDAPACLSVLRSDVGHVSVVVGMSIHPLEQDALLRAAAPKLLEALLELRELAASGSAEMAIIDEACATAGRAPWRTRLAHDPSPAEARLERIGHEGPRGTEP